MIDIYEQIQIKKLENTNHRNYTYIDFKRTALNKIKFVDKFFS
jgi:hypothetical protein